MNKNIFNNGIGFVGILTIAFIVLKITGIISWSWIWVLSPLWISLIGILVVTGFVFLMIALFYKSNKRK